MDFLVYIFYRTFVFLISLLPLTVVFAAGRFLGTLCYFAAAPYRRLAARNLTIAFGDEKNPREIRRLARRHFSALGANLFSSIKIASMPREKILKIVKIENFEAARAVAASGRGVVLVISHIGNWELFGQIMPMIVEKGCKAGTIYQRLSNRYIDAHVRAGRARLGLHLFERKEGFNGAMQVLREAGGVGVLVDQHAGDSGIWTPFFGRLASTSPLAAMLALRTGAALIPAAVYTDGFAKWRMVISPALEPESRDTDLLAAEINQALERQIRVSPPDWFWVHNRWKTPFPNFLLARYKRGLCFPPGFDPAALKPFRILIRSSNWLGDAVMTVPAVQAIKRGRPDAQVTILTRDKLADFWRRVPRVDAVIAIKANESVFQVAKKISASFDVAVLFPNSVRAALEAWLAGIPRRVGCRSKWRGALLNQIAPDRDKKLPPEHQVFHYLRLAEFMGAEKRAEGTTAKSFECLSIPDPDHESKLKIQKSTATDAKQRPGFQIESAPFRIGLCPGADYGPAKRWPSARYAEVMRAVSGQRECEWVIFGTDKDRPIAEEIKTTLAVPDPYAASPACADLTGKTTLAGLIDELSRCRLLLTNDTGTMHLAAFLGVPTVSVFGSTEPLLTAPLGEGHRIIRHHVPCSPCFLRECPLDFRCMLSVSVDEVADAVLEML